MSFVLVWFKYISTKNERLKNIVLARYVKNVNKKKTQ